MSKKKILHIINTLERGGAELLLTNTLPDLEKYDNYFCWLRGPEVLAIHLRNNKKLCLNHRSYFNSLSSIYKLRRFISINNIDIVHSHLFECTLLARIASLGIANHIFTVHNVLSEDAFKKNRISLLFEKITHRISKMMIGVSDTVILDYKNSIKPKIKINKIYNYIDSKYFNISRKSYDFAKSPLRLIAVGNLRSQKNYSILIDSFKYLKNYQIELDIYGSGDLFDYLSSLIMNNKYPISLKGNEHNISEIIADYDIYISASLYEGYGIAPVEAMAVGLPVILSDIPVFREIAPPETLFFNPTSSKEIASCILCHYENRSTSSELSIRLKNHAIQIASKEKYLSLLTTIYNSL